MTETLHSEAALLATLTEAERDFVEHLLRAAPNFRYSLTEPPEGHPAPAPGLESAVIAAKMVTASEKLWI